MRWGEVRFFDWLYIHSANLLVTFFLVYLRMAKQPKTFWHMSIFRQNSLFVVRICILPKCMYHFLWYLQNWGNILRRSRWPALLSRPPTFGPNNLFVVRVCILPKCTYMFCLNFRWGNILRRSRWLASWRSSWPELSLPNLPASVPPIFSIGGPTEIRVS